MYLILFSLIAFPFFYVVVVHRELHALQSACVVLARENEVCDRLLILTGSFLHELDIKLELHLNRYFNLNLIGGKLNKIFCVQAKCHESARENPLRRSFGSLYITHRYSVLKTIKQGFKYFQKHPHSKKVQYIRYVDHFILVVDGDKKRAYDVLAFIATILDSLGMTLSTEKSSVKSSTKGVVFLGYYIHSQCSFDINLKKRKSLKVCDYTLHLNVPLQNLFQCFAK